MRPEHKILEKKPSKNSTPQLTTPKEKKRKLKKTSDKQNIETNEKQVPVKVEVSKEKHYSVADSLKDAFRNTENQGEFRLSALFDQQIKQGLISFLYEKKFYYHFTYKIRIILYFCDF